jgi:MFS family permease
LIIFTWVLFASSVFLLLTHIVPHAIDIGFSAGQAATILSLIGFAVIVGRVTMGVISDRIGRKRATIISALLQAGAMVWLIWARELWMFYLFALIYGFAYGGIGPCMAALVGDTFGLRRIGSIIGVLDAGFSAGAAIGPAIGGLIFDAYRSYNLAFWFTVVALLGVALLVVFIKREVEAIPSSQN